MNQPKRPEAAVRLVWETPRTIGAVAIGRLWSRDPAQLDALLETLTAKPSPAIGQFAHVQLAQIDDGLIVRLASTSALIMPHGGPRIVARLEAWIRSQGVCAARVAVVPDPRDDVDAAMGGYPEANCFGEALALAAISTAASARAIPLLLAQPKRIADAIAAGWRQSAASRARDARLMRLIHPPRIVAIGAANVGKSSLINAVAGRTVAIAMDFAGTTRDAVAARVELDGLVVDWFDTPGIRSTQDEVERAAQSLAEKLREGADLLLTITAPGIPCPVVASAIPRISICTRVDLDPNHESEEARTAAVWVSATHRTGLAQLAVAIRTALVHDDDLDSQEPWVFHPAVVEARGR
ncbi:MAG: GTP-binding protein [Phycisphaerales bacterium]|nr:GTP-binding protein [Phycisphaerales bacterium]